MSYAVAMSFALSPIIVSAKDQVNNNVTKTLECTKDKTKWKLTITQDDKININNINAWDEIYVLFESDNCKWKYILIKVVIDSMLWFDKDQKFFKWDLNWKQLSWPIMLDTKMSWLEKKMYENNLWMYDSGNIVHLTKK